MNIIANCENSLQTVAEFGVPIIYAFPNPTKKIMPLFEAVRRDYLAHYRDVLLQDYFLFNI